MVRMTILVLLILFSQPVAEAFYLARIEEKLYVFIFGTVYMIIGAIMDSLWRKYK